MSPSEVSLQINLSGGDFPYASVTVPALVAAHRPRVREVFAVVDCCRPQRTQMIDPDRKFPLTVFNERVEAIRALADRFHRNGLFDRVIYIESGDQRIRRLLKQYVGPFVTETHDCYGCGLVSYLFGFDEARTRFLLHYDADMLVYQADGSDWSEEGVQRLLEDPNAIAATPRISPPFAAQLRQPDSPSLAARDAPTGLGNAVWRIDWFSARCFLIDLQRLRPWLPLLTWRRPAYFCEVLVRKILARGYPPTTEGMIHRRASSRGAYRVDLRAETSFLIHPNDKGERFLRLLPGILKSVQQGRVPIEQRGRENVVLDAWEGNWDGRHVGGALDEQSAAVVK